MKHHIHQFVLIGIVCLHVSTTMLTIYSKYDISESFNEKIKSQYCFEKIQKHIAIDSLIQNILLSNEIHDDHEIC